ncbi:hypothetical protein DPMN_083550 [Dreissena polymorpha]|uniref:Uncharacterized protein n=1 Tax=Dreissena polymorpha TaxID=45954 RepID=A0A9D3YA37_DREPO|nr:hypothetical protein DPMN_083550 [Dreissena polymorpha]
MAELAQVSSLETELTRLRTLVAEVETRDAEIARLRNELETMSKQQAAVSTSAEEESPEKLKEVVLVWF